MKKTLYNIFIALFVIPSAIIAIVIFGFIVIPLLIGIMIIYLTVRRFRRNRYHSIRFSSEVEEDYIDTYAFETDQKEIESDDT